MDEVVLVCHIHNVHNVTGKVSLVVWTSDAFPEVVWVQILKWVQATTD